MQAEATVATSNKLRYIDLSAEQRTSVDGLYQNMLLVTGSMLDRLRECNNKQVSLGDVKDSWIVLGSECGLYYVPLENVVSIDLDRVKTSIKHARINLVYDMPDYFLCMEIPKAQVPVAAKFSLGSWFFFSADTWIALLLFLVVSYFVFFEHKRDKILAYLMGKYYNQQ
jgi:hypothetical protein